MVYVGIEVEVEVVLIIGYLLDVGFDVDWYDCGRNGFDDGCEVCYLWCFDVDWFCKGVGDVGWEIGG